MQKETSEKPVHSERAALRLLIQRIPDACLLETDRSGTITWIENNSEIFFGYAPHEVLGKFKYENFHPPDEMEACKNDPEFKREVSEQGWSEDEWTVVPKEGPTFRAIVTLVRNPTPAQADSTSGGGWLALYRKAPNK